MKKGALKSLFLANATKIATKKLKNTDPATNDLIINNVKNRIEACMNMPPYMRSYKIKK